MRATPIIPPIEQTPQPATKPKKKPPPKVVDLAVWMGGGRREVFYPFSDTGNYPPRRAQ